MNDRDDTSDEPPTPRAEPTTERGATIAKWTLIAVVSAAAMYLVMLMYAGGHVVVGTLWMAFYALAAYVYASRRAYTYRYLFPGLAGMGVFVVFPLLFTMWLGFTEYSSSNVLTFERATEVLLSKTYELPGERYELELHRDGDEFRIVLIPEGQTLPAPSGSIFDAPAPTGSIFDEPDAAAEPADTAPAKPVYVTPRLALASTDPVTVDAQPLDGSGFTPGTAEPVKTAIDRQDALGAITVTLPGGAQLVKTTLRTFAASRPLYVVQDGALVDQQTGVVYTPDFDIGFYVTEDGIRVTPGFRVFVGFKHYARMLTDRGFLQPFLRIFLWTVAFAGFTVLLTLFVGAMLGELLQWEELRFRGLYRVLLFLPYAVPGFLSILVFKGLFNSSFGEINQLLDMIIGVKPQWFESPVLAKVMILIVNTWLGYPYIMLLWMGLRQSISKDLYEASALAGAGPFTNFFKITWPLVRKPLTPLLVSSFAFNFNNFVLIALLTDGRPDFLDTSVPAGTTDILVSYTYRIAFQDSGKNYGLAAAISTVIFVMVAALSLLNLKLTKANEDGAH